jgi:hypothetical protein
VGFIDTDTDADGPIAKGGLGTGLTGAQLSDASDHNP